MLFIKALVALTLFITAAVGAPAPLIDAAEVETVNVVVKGE